MDKAQLTGLALDIDDTLSWTCREWADLLLTEFGNPENLSKHEFEKKYRLLENAPYFQRDDILARCRELCMDTDSYHWLPPIEGALHAIMEIEKVVPIVAYITARPELLRDTTSAWLETHGFPKAELHMNPEEFSFQRKGNWKQEVLEKLYPRITGIIDDHFNICNALSDDYPGVVFLYRHEHASSPHPRAIACGEWDDVVIKVRNHFAPHYAS